MYSTGSARASPAREVAHRSFCPVPCPHAYLHVTVGRGCCVAPAILSPVFSQFGQPHGVESRLARVLTPSPSVSNPLVKRTSGFRIRLSTASSQAHEAAARSGPRGETPQWPLHLCMGNRRVLAWTPCAPSQKVPYPLSTYSSSPDTPRVLPVRSMLASLSVFDSAGLVLLQGGYPASDAPPRPLHLAHALLRWTVPMYSLPVRPLKCGRMYSPEIESLPPCIPELVFLSFSVSPSRSSTPRVHLNASAAWPR